VCGILPGRGGGGWHHEGELGVGARFPGTPKGGFGEQLMWGDPGDPGWPPKEILPGVPFKPEYYERDPFPWVDDRLSCYVDRLRKCLCESNDSYAKELCKILSSGSGLTIGLRKFKDSSGLSLPGHLWINPSEYNVPHDDLASNPCVVYYTLLHELAHQLSPSGKAGGWGLGVGSEFFTPWRGYRYGAGYNPADTIARDLLLACCLCTPEQVSELTGTHEHNSWKGFWGAIDDIHWELIGDVLL
jgi:hypothetical protein